MTDRHIEDMERRCPRLGGSVVSVSYCTTSGTESLPCFKMPDCWWEAFDVDAYLKERLAGPLYRRFIESAQKPQNKISSLIEMINMAKRSKIDRT
ncbi:MAG: hypothetical protein MUE70_11275 [Desulfobacterales bacterium]|jgi:hypothetical protein|nr:hypothetical protein [Desulfobacterales bacterium]